MVQKKYVLSEKNLSIQKKGVEILNKINFKSSTE